MKTRNVLLAGCAALAFFCATAKAADKTLLLSLSRGRSSGETPTMPATPPDNWPTFHLLHPGPGHAMPGDPNCAFYWKGVYHLHYIYNSGGCGFAHLSSTDLVHWKWHRTTLTQKTTGHGMFSGTGFITKEGTPAIIYHGQGTNKNQIALAEDDDLEEWSQPVAMDIREPDGQPSTVRQWDPDCWLSGDTYYAISGGSPPHLMKSKDLKTWANLGRLFHDQMPAAALNVSKDEDVSCANMFKIGNKWMLLCISHPLGCRYYLGDFKDEKFLPDFHSMMSWNGNNFFAPESVLTKDGRRVMWAWLLNLPIAPTGIQSLPRELELPKDGVLRIRPLRELEVLRGKKKEEKKIAVTSDTLYAPKEISGNAIELEVSFKATTAKEFGLDVLCDSNGANGMRVAYLPESKTLRVGAVNAPFELKKDEELTLRIFVDKNLVEVFANDRQAALSAAAYARANLGIRLMSKGGDTTVRSFKCWTMKSIYTAPK
jgi:beta-fructofuranosidase